MIWRKFKALGTDIIFYVLPENEKQNILNEAERIVIKFEKRFSRFIKNNELTLFNNSEITEMQVSKTMVELLKEARNYFIKTDGIYDPTVIGSLEKIGYDKNFLDIGRQSDNVLNKKNDLEKIKKEFGLRFRMSNVKIEGNKVIKPVGLRVDFGGIGKGYIVDNLSKTVFSEIKNFLISAGGDILATGNQKDGKGWDVAIQNPYKPEENIFFVNTGGKKLGIASSGIAERSGVKNNFQWNHIIDPKSGLSVLNNILSVTVISSSATRSDIYAKTVLILGEEAGLEFIEKESDSACIIFTKNNNIIFSKRADLYLKNNKYKQI